MICKLGYMHEKWKMGVKTPVFWDTAFTPHICISGITGGGKSVCSQLVANALLSERKDIFICDFKAGGDWDCILPESRYAEYTDTDRLLDAFYQSFLDSVKGRRKSEKYLFIDEFSSYALTKDSKEFKALMSKISHIAFMGRSFGYHLIFISQQFNAKVLDTAIREQFGIKIYMGSTISSESASMLFPDCEIDKSVHLPEHCGYISMPGKELAVIQIPHIDRPCRLKRLLIRKGAAYSAAL